MAIMLSLSQETAKTIVNIASNYPTSGHTTPFRELPAYTYRKLIQTILLVNYPSRMVTYSQKSASRNRSQAWMHHSTGLHCIDDESQRSTASHVNGTE